MKHSNAEENSKKRRPRRGSRVWKEDKEAARKAAMEIIKKIISDPEYATYFFFEEMSPKMSGLAASYNRAYGLDLQPEDVSSAAYLYCWEDDWSKLRAFKGETTPHAWVGRLSSQAIYRFLIEEKYIEGVGNTKASDYRLTVRGLELEELRQGIVDLVSIPDQHKALELYYVKKVSDKELAEAFGSKELAEKILKEGEKTLIEQLLNTENPYADVALSSKKAIDPEVEWQSWYDCVDEGDVSENHQALRDALTNIYQREDWDENVKTFVNDVVVSFHWTEMQTTIWNERFFHNTPSKELAVRFGVRHTLIDNTYSRLNKQFRIAVKTWWNENYN